MSEITKTKTHMANSKLALLLFLLRNKNNYLVIERPFGCPRFHMAVYKRKLFKKKLLFYEDCLGMGFNYSWIERI